MTGPVVIDYKGDRVMDYQVWYLASDSDKFTGYMRIPLTKAGRNTTVCVDWLVNNMYNSDRHAYVCHSLKHMFMSDYGAYDRSTKIRIKESNALKTR